VSTCPPERSEGSLRDAETLRSAQGDIAFDVARLAAYLDSVLGGSGEPLEVERT
jgi:hypothetical protein